MSTDPVIETVTLPAEVTLRQVAVVHAELQAALGRGRPIRIDGTGVGHADICLFQVLAAARLSAARSGVVLSLSLPPDGPVELLLRLSGLSARLS